MIINDNNSNNDNNNIMIPKKHRQINTVNMKKTIMW